MYGRRRREGKEPTELALNTEQRYREGRRDGFFCHFHTLGFQIFRSFTFSTKTIVFFSSWIFRIPPIWIASGKLLAEVVKGGFSILSHPSLKENLNYNLRSGEEGNN